MEEINDRNEGIRKLQVKIQSVKEEFYETNRIVKEMMSSDDSSHEFTEKCKFQRYKLEGLRKQLGDLERTLIAEVRR